jgi:hypothetical protein
MLGFMIAIACLALILLPLVLIFSGTISYTFNSLDATLNSSELKMGFEILLNYNSFFDLKFPCIYFYFTFDNKTLFDLLIEFVPPSLESALGELETSKLNSSAKHSSLITSSSSEEIWIISPYIQNWIPGFWEFDTSGNLNLNFDYNGDYNKQDIALKYTIERLDFSKPDIIGYVYPKETSNGYKFSDIITISEGFFKIKVEAVNKTTLEILETINPAEKTFRVHDTWSFFTGMFDTFGFFGVSIPLIDMALVYGTHVDGFMKSLGYLGLTSFYIFASFFFESLKPEIEWGEPQYSYLQGIFTVSIITGLLFLYQTVIGYGGIPGNLIANKEMFLLYYSFVNSPIFTHNVFKIFDLFGMTTGFVPIGGFLFDLGIGLKDILLWMIALDMTSYAMYLRPDVFKPCGLVISFGMIGFGIIGWIITIIHYFHWMEEN